MPDSIEAIVAALQRGELDADIAISELHALQRGFTQSSLGRFDIEREARTGVPEAIFAQGKTPQMLVDAFSRALERDEQLIATRLTDPQLEALATLLPRLHHHPTARVLATHPPTPPADAPRLIVLAAGTSDLPVAEEAAQCAALFGLQVETAYDVGVAGIHRLFNELERIRAADVIITVAGMEGALPSVVAGLVRAPLIAVPTSIGYGAHFGGLSALLTMLNTCAPGVAVCNIDNGFGAAVLAKKIASLATPRQASTP